MILILAVFFFCNRSFCQESDNIPQQCHHLGTNSYQCKWKFFVLDKPVHGQVISYARFRRSCGIEWTASVCIIASDNDTFRVILQCFSDDLKTGQTVAIGPDIEPTFSVGVPMDSKFYQETYNTGKPVWRINEYDDRILRTTWGHVYGNK